MIFGDIKVLLKCGGVVENGMNVNMEDPLDKVVPHASIKTHEMQNFHLWTRHKSMKNNRQ